jgi:hypothetical protein
MDNSSIINIIEENGIESGSITVIIKDKVPLQINIDKQVYRRVKQKK